MQCAWPSTRSRSGKTFAAALPLAGLTCAILLCVATCTLTRCTLAWSTVTPPSRTVLRPTPLTQLEKELRSAPAHISEFSPVSEPLALPKCGSVAPPEALLTPDPLLQPQDDDLNVRVSFIVGTDGHVHSPFVLDSGGPSQDLLVLRAVRLWRYRPALCNGVPTDFEALVRFRIR